MIDPSAEISSVADVRNAASWAELPDAELLERVQRQTFGFFWQRAEALQGLAPDRCTTRADALDGPAAIGGTGFGVMALIVAVERGWIGRSAAIERLAGMLAALTRATRHFLNARTGATIPFSAKDDGGDLVETSFLCMGLLCARQYFARDCPSEAALREQVTLLWEQVEWNWYTRDGRAVLYWHWSPHHGWAMNHPIRGWDECLITYLLAASAPRHAIDASVYHHGFASGEGFVNGRSYYGIELPLGMPYGGPLFFSHYSFCGLDPRGLRDRYADYWQQNVRHVRINRAHCIVNPYGHKGYGAYCWGLTASDDPDGYVAHAPDLDNGTIAPTAALASLPYAPREVLDTLRHFLSRYGARIWGRYGFVDAFCEQRNWYADTYLAIDQGPIVVLIENYRTGLLWKLFMSVAEVQAGLRRLEFTSPYLNGPVAT
jgi:hypothetical protein